MTAAVVFLLKNLTSVLMLTIGLRTAPSALRAAWSDRALVGKALFVVVVCVPLLAVCVVTWLPLAPPATGFVLLMAACPGAPLVLRTYRDSATGVAIIAIVSLVAPITVVAWVAVWNRLFGYAIVVDPIALLRVGLVQLVSLAAGVALAALSPRIAPRLARVTWACFIAGFVLALVVALVLGAPALLRVRAITVVAVVAVALGSAALGHVAGGPELTDRAMLATTAVLGNPALALAVIAATYPGFRAGALFAAYLAVRGLALAAYTLWVKYRPPARERAPARGGPFVRALAGIHLTDAHGHVRWGWIVAIVWVPMLAGALVSSFVPALDPIVRDPVMHVRIVIALPIVLVAERLLDTRCDGAIARVREERIVDDARLDAIVVRGERLRDMWIVELAIAVAVALIGQAELWGAWSRAGLLGARSVTNRGSFAAVWCLGVALPLFQFVVARWLWRWIAWCYVVVRFARRPVDLDALHPDRAAGLSVLASPVDAFALAVAGIGSVASAAWIMQLHDQTTTAADIGSTFFTLFAAIVIVAVGPLFAFAPQLYEARRRDAGDCHVLARAFADEFRRRWIAERVDDPERRATEIQALANLGDVYKTANGTRLYPFGARTIVTLWTGALVPMVPIVFATAPVSQAVVKLGRMMFRL
ncbi:MAG TPA: hypothetical protein VGG74_17515 [Kofleriaceae bacterium]|jgi:BASS family bile acid:Na+ symporter